MAKKKTAPAADQGTSGSMPVGGKAAIMKARLDAQPKVAIMIPLSPGEVSGSTESVILNGHRVNIRKGEYVYVPEQVARVIMESQQQTEQAIQNYFLMNAEGQSAAMRKKQISN
jgi:hypothetical protein